MPYSAAASGVRCSRRSSLLRHGLDLRRHLGLGDRLLEVGQLLLVGALVAQLALDGGHLLAQQHLALARRRARPWSCCRSRPTAAAPPGDGRAAARPCRAAAPGRWSPGCPASPPAWRRDRSRRGRPACRATSSPPRSGAARAARCGSRSSTSRTCSCSTRKRASISGPVDGRLGDVQAARQQEGVAFDELGDAEALHALADQVMAAFRGW